MSKPSDKLTQTGGILLKKDAFVVIVRTEWNADVVDELVRGSREFLEENGVRTQVVEVPGAFEIPFAIKKIAGHSAGPQPDAFIALACVIRGDTPHFDYVCTGVTQGLMDLNLSLPMPVINGVLTVNDQMQADERIGGRAGHKGVEAAAAAVKMIALFESSRTAGI